MTFKIRFPFEQKTSPLFGRVYRPMAVAELWSRKTQGWIHVAMLVDTGADYTLLPKIYANHFGIELERDGQVYDTMGIGGRERVYLIERWPIQLGNWRHQIPIGFLTRNDIPPLLGRQDCLERLKVTFFRHQTTFSLR